MSTLWERLTGIGLQDQQELIDLDKFKTLMLLTGWGVIPVQQTKAQLGLTPEQGDELDGLNTGGSRVEDVLVWVQRMRYTLEGSRMGLSALDSIPNVQQALSLI